MGSGGKGSYTMFRAGALGLIWEIREDSRESRERHSQGDAWVSVWGKRSTGQTGRGKAAEHVNSRSTD